MKAKIIISLCLMFLISTFGCQKNVNQDPASFPQDSKLVCLFFDDAYANQYEETLHILLEYDFKATFGVITNHIGKGHDLWEYMNERKLRVLADHGMDIGGHTKTHPDLTTLTDEQMRDEIIGSKQALENMGFEVRTMLYPYFTWNDKVIEYTKEAGYTCGRAGWTERNVYDINTDDPEERYHVTAWQISDQDMDTFKIIVGRADYNSVVCLVYHFIADTGPEGTATPVANFQEQMAYLYNTGYTVVLLPDLFK
ncbi:MAG: polysaccharide deacetylase family protein [Dehalococcoidales bacterium]|nr:polysaccharide deacetylase family protein [Dehalococcoidales bacterium]